MSTALVRTGVSLGIILIGLAAYWPGLGGDLFFDSIPIIAQNDAIKITDLSLGSLMAAAVSFPTEAIGRPLPMITFALNWYLGGPNPFWFKLTSLVIHLGNGLLVYALGLRLLRLRAALLSPPGAAGSAEWIAAFAALLWVIAPVHGFTVPYVIQRMVLLGALFALLALHSYLSLRAALAAGAVWRSLAFSILMLVAAGLSLLSKQTAVLIPFYILVIEVFLLDFGGMGSRRRLLVVGVWIAAALPILMQGYYFLSNASGMFAGYELRNFTPSERVLTQGRVLVMYLRNVFLPDYHQLHFFYDDLPVSHSLSEPVTTALSMALLAALAGAAVFLRRRVPLLGFGVFWFLAGHSLESGVWCLELVFWHRNYLPSFGPLFALAAGLLWMARQTGGLRQAAIVLSALLVAWFGATSWQVSRDWTTRAAMARAELAKSPDSARAQYYYARLAVNEYAATKEPRLLADGEWYLRQSLERNPSSLLPSHGLLVLALEHGRGSVPDVLGELGRRAAGARFPIGDETAFQELVKLHTKYPERLSAAEVLQVLDSALGNPLALDVQKAWISFCAADLLRYDGAPESRWLPYLRRAAGFDPKGHLFPPLLFKILVDAGEIDEAAAVRARSITSIDRIKDPQLAQYEEKLLGLLEAKRSAPSPGASGTPTLPDGGH